MNSKSKICLAASTAMLTILSSGWAQAQTDGRSDGDNVVNDLYQPGYAAPSAPGAGDNLGNHSAIQALNMSGNPIIGLGDPIDLTDGVNLGYLQSYLSANGDNLGNHTATADLNMDTFMIRVGPPQGPTDAANRAYVDSAVLAATGTIYTAGSGLAITGNQFSVNSSVVRTTAAQTIGGAKTFSSPVIVPAPLLITHAANKGYVDAAITAGQIPYTAGHGLTLTGSQFAVDSAVVMMLADDQTVGGIKTFSNPINVPTPSAATHAATKAYVDAAVLAGDTDTNTTYTSGSGLTLTGTVFAVDATVIRTTGTQTLGGVKTFSSPVNVATPTAGAHATTKAYVDAAILAGDTDTNTTYTSGSGLSLTGTVFAVDATVIRTTGTQTLGGVKTFSSPVNVATPTAAAHATTKAYVDAAVLAAGTVDTDTTYTAGAGLALSGTVFSLDTDFGDARYALSSRILSAGAGLTGGGDLTADRSFAVDSSAVMMLAGNQSVAGIKTFASPVNVATPTAAAHATTKAYVDAAVASGGTAYTAGSGLSLTGTAFAVDATVIRTTGTQTLGGVKTFSSPVNVATPTAGAHATTKDYVDAAILAGDTNTTYTAGSGMALTGTAFAVDATVIRTTGNQTLAGVKTFSSPVVVPTPTAAAHAATKAYVDGAIASGGTPYSAGVGLSLTGTTFAVDSATVMMLTGAQSVAGAKTFSSPVVVPTPTAAAHAATKAYVDGAIASGGTPYSAGAGLTLTSNTFAVDSTAVMMLAGNQTVAGIKSFSSPVNVATPTAAAHATTKAYVDAAITAGNTTYTAGSGLTLTGTSFAVDSSAVMMLAGSQTVAGIKTFSSPVNVATPTAAAHATTKAYVDAAVAASGTSYTAGAGLTLTGNSFAVDSSAVMMLAGNQTVAGIKTFTSTIAGSINGNAATATTLATARTINGMAFNGSANITLPTVNLTGDQNVGGIKNFTNGIQVYESVNSAPSKVRFGRNASQYISLFGGTPGNYIQSQTLDANTRPLILRLSTETLDQQFVFQQDGRITGVSTPNNAVDVANKAYVDATVAAGNTTYTAGSGLTLTGTSFAVDSSAVMMLAGNQTVAGIKTFSSPVNVATPTAAAHATTKAYVDAAILAGDTDTTYTAGAGLRLTGTAFSLDTTWADGRYALAARTLTAGAGLTGGGDLTANRSFAVDNTAVMMLTGNQTAAGTKTFTATGDFSNANSLRLRNGVTGSGVIMRNDGAAFYMLLTDTGMAQAGSFNSLRPFMLNTSTGLVTMATGVKVGGGLDMSNTQISNVSAPTLNHHAANKLYVDQQVAAAGTDYTAGVGITITGASIDFSTAWGDARYALASRSILPGYGLIGGGALTADRTLAIDGAHSRRAGTSAAAGVMAHNGSAKTDSQFYSGSSNPTGTARVNYDGSLYATNFWATNYFYFSDRNLKKDIQPMDAKTGMGLVRDLKPVSFAWKSNGAKALGLIAQEVEETIPTAVTTNEAGTKAVDYVQLISPMLAAIQELDGRVKALETAAK